MYQQNNPYGYYPQQMQQPYYQGGSRYSGMAPQMPQQMPQGLKGRPVSSLDEVRASGIDFDGSVFYFPDLANKRIYTKQIGMDGTASLNVYELKNLQIPPSSQLEQTSTPVPSYVSKDEFEKVVTTLVQEINALKGELKNESTSNVSSTQF